MKKKLEFEHKKENKGEPKDRFPKKSETKGFSEKKGKKK